MKSTAVWHIVVEDVEVDKNVEAADQTVVIDIVDDRNLKSPQYTKRSVAVTY